MKAMNYENFMRMVYRCGRNYNLGADADIYRKMELAIAQLEHPETSTKPGNTLEFEARAAISAVRGNVDTALKKAALEIYNIEDRVKLGELLLNIPFMEYNREAIDDTIAKSIEVLKKHDFKAQ